MKTICSCQLQTTQSIFVTHRKQSQNMGKLKRNSLHCVISLIFFFFSQGGGRSFYIVHTVQWGRGGWSSSTELCLFIHTFFFFNFPVDLGGPAPRWVCTIWQMDWFAIWEGSGGFLSTSQIWLGSWPRASTDKTALQTSSFAKIYKFFIILVVPKGSTAVSYEQGKINYLKRVKLTNFNRVKINYQGAKKLSI